MPKNQFGFMPRRSSIEEIHLIKSLMEKYRERQKDPHLAFIYLEKAYDSVPRDLIWKTLIDKGASRRYIKVIEDMYNDAKTQVRASIGNTEFFLVEVGLRVICNKNVPFKLKGKFYRADIRPAMLYGSKCWPITKALANRMEVVELRMIRRRPQSAPVRRVEALVVDIMRRRGRPKLRWEDKVKLDMKELLLSEDMTSDRNEWRAKTNSDRLKRWASIRLGGSMEGLEVVVASRRKREAMISKGQFVARLAEHFRLLTEQRLQGLAELDDTWAWAAPRPERQPDDAVGALEVVEDALDIVEGAQAVPTPIQAPQPPPAAVPARSLP
nr:retrovirus-related Pol polyprotein LINE-1 [Tanacetum cinerariifolium]